ncbi:Ferrous-iron efflux pump FieF [Anatilimnocola aggregata]|uniref:Ferrous-iron efflux pump FieF n=1 Tax=Anatilimnocola aggregata TaxID=2528021 RepID=A0A517Y861_9BACT|nr:cation diffusion facilitator family transporter [Anatilimnocola aggregata]QDU26428.1 Ferrous-iron efflux pump FieF [Anatilimnocola aggregata]
MPSPEPASPETITQLPLVSVAVNAALAAIKILAGVVGNSYALIADGIESTSDIVTSLVVWGGLQVAVSPADEKHPYGYGKAEALAGIVAALALLVAAVVIAVQSVREILTPHHLPHWSTLLVLGIVVVTKEVMARWIGKIGAAADSSSLQADAWHHRSDALTSFAAFVGITIGLIGGPGYEPADDWAALVACVVIVYSGVHLMRMAIRDLLDAAPPKHFAEQVRQVASQVEGVRAVEKCRIRKSGMTFFVEIHIEVDAFATVQEGHFIGGRVRSALRTSNLRIADAFVHVEPHSTDEVGV